ncbi:MAG: MBL fold metallo-hydrolase [Candidatus Aminicenantes bacterium]|nr:MBL fold metallo-hydrolase [Candidatus Aminicenantes bacterium]
MFIKFLGAAQQVTGSCYYLEAGGLKLMIDCGLFQEREFLSRNWETFPVPPQNIDYVLLSHVHVDHCGLLPKLVLQGFSGKILTTAPSFEMLPIVLEDSAHIQEEDAAYKKKRHRREGRKGPYPEIPLYTVEDAMKVFPLIEAVPYKKKISLNKSVSVCFHDAGHILGSAMIEIIVKDGNKKKNIVFSGDIGQWNKPLVKDPTIFESADYIVMESTYGDRNHEDSDGVDDLLAHIIRDTIGAGGNVVIPTFAIERAQELMFYLSGLVREDRIPYMMMFLDSPMAVDITDVFQRHVSSLDKESRRLFAQGHSPFRFPGMRLIRSVEESKAINNIKGSCLIMAGSGMCTGGRIKHHLKPNIAKAESTILFVGYQVKGTLGREIINGRESVRIHGRMFPVNARIEQIQGFSAHADRDDLLDWLGALETPPTGIFLTHGEKEAMSELSRQIERKLNWPVHMPEYLEEIELD